MPAHTPPDPKFIGKSFGKWKVIDISPIGKYLEKYLCQCECGLEKWFHSLKYITNSCKKCIPSKYIAHEGDTFSSWTVMDEVIGGSKGVYRSYKCQCFCGVISWVRADHLIKKESTGCKRCGCAKNSKRRISSTSSGISRGIGKNKKKRTIKESSENK